jgi:hypothetical protein
MEYYGNISGHSNVSRYEIGADYITVEFKTISKRDGSTTYKYSHNSAGSTSVERMKELARQGSGLNGFISHNKVAYESKY